MNLHEYLIATHRRCRLLLGEVCHLVACADWVAAQHHCRAFCTEMDSHFADEEEIVYPLFEQATAMPQGPTEVMRYEHDQMRELMEALYQAVAAADPVQFEQLAASLQLLLQQHNVKEETILYPFCQPGPEAMTALQAGTLRRG